MNKCDDNRAVNIMDIINKSPVVAFIWENSKGGPVSFVTPNVSHLLGYSAEEFITGKRNWTSIVHHDDLDRVLREVKDFSENSSHTNFSHQPYRIIKKDGRIIWVSARVQIKRNEKNNITHYQGIIEDVTEQLKLLEEKHQFETRLRQSDKMEAIGKLAGGIAHEFNNILSIILGNAELAMDDIPRWNPARFNLNEIKSAGLRARNTVKQLLSFSQNLKVKHEPIKIGTVIKASKKLLQAIMPASVQIRLDVQDDSSMIHSNPNQIHQVLINLCTNAAQAMEKNGGTLEISLRSIRYNNHPPSQYRHINAGSYVQLTVRDTGLGIDDKIKDKIFDPYFTTRKIGKGSGMGLAIVYGIVKHHKGAIYIQSNPGAGTTVTVLFPKLDNSATQKKAPRREQTATNRNRVTLHFPVQK